MSPLTFCSKRWTFSESVFRAEPCLKSVYFSFYTELKNTVRISEEITFGEEFSMKVPETFAGDPTEIAAVSWLYEQLISSWDKRDAKEYSQLFTDEANLIGFDGSTYEDRLQIKVELGAIFENHPTPHYVTSIQSVRLLTPEVGLLRAYAGMRPQDQTELDPNLNAIQTMVAVKQNGRWSIASFQNTPAAFHGHPELAEKMTEELNEVLKETSKV